MKEDFVSFFQKYKSDTAEIYDKLCQLQYEDLQPAIYTLAKVKKIIELCNYLEEQKTSGEDTDKLKIFLLTSHSEIAARLITEEDQSSKDLVNKYFKSIKKESKLDTLIRGRVKNPHLILLAADTLYAISNEYAHQGNFTGNVFQHESSRAALISSCSSKIYETDIKPKDIAVEYKVTYKKFLELYCKALQNLLSMYYEQKNSAYTPPIHPPIA